MRSLKARLIALWGLSLVSSLILCGLLVGVSRQSTQAQIGRTQAVLARTCDLVQDRYGFYMAGASAPELDDPGFRRDLHALLDVVLARREGLEGGIWAGATGSLAYGFPTYEGSGPKTDFPAAEAPSITAVTTEAAREERTVSRAVPSRSQTLLLAACPLEGPIPGLTAWVMGRVHEAADGSSIRAGLMLLLSLLVVTSVVLGRTLFVWGRHVRGIAQALGDATGSLPALPRSGERELDRIVDALNVAGRRLAEAQREAAALASRVAGSERLAALGRVAAGVAHEIRNPLAAARLQGENALAGDDQRRRAGIGDMLVQLDRLDGLVSELLAMTQRVEPAPSLQETGRFLEACIARHAALAATRGLRVLVTASSGAARFDPAIVGRILDNLLANAIRHAAPGGVVTLSAVLEAGRLTMTVTDDGDGVAPPVAERLFEPFVTGRADGTGLGLAIARELADAHGGRVVLRDRDAAGAVTAFALELPQDAPP